MSHARPASLKAVLAAIDSGATTGRDAFETFAARSEVVEPSIGAFASADWAAARAAVTGLERAPLRGLPVGVKDIVATRHLPTSCGSPAYAGHRPATDAAIVECLRDVGATLPVKTTTTEFAFMQPTATRNPHDLDHNPGGSSAGSAAAVAAGMLPAAIGSQTAGSTVRPASFCGVTGFKPTYGRLPVAGLKPFSPGLDTVGLFTAGADDMRVFFAALTGEPVATGRPEAHDLTLAILRAPWDGEASPSAHDAFERGLEALSRAGIRLIERPLPEALVTADAVHATIQAFEARIELEQDFTKHRALLSPLLADYLTGAGDISQEAYQAALARAQGGRAAVRALLGDVDAVVHFAAADVAPAGFAMTGSPRFNRLWTLMGLPAISVPGMTAGHLPVGLQLIGTAGDDARLLAVAETVWAALR